ncbi:MAG: hypothetical protein GXY32_05960 [Ruminococcaceae bacterium]|nr:hypothetical protein [Oscillospiraceae bacterium]
MFRFGRRPGNAESAGFVPVSPYDSKEALQARIEHLSGDEAEIYKWLREFYSERWIAETLLLEKCEAKEKIRHVYFKLGVKNKRALIRAYGGLPRPQTGPVDTGEIDSYIDARTEKAVRNGLWADETKKGGNKNG